jgi:outer membrane protein
MLKTRVLLLASSAILIWLLYQLPKSVVENESAVVSESDTIASHIDTHVQVPAEFAGSIRQLRQQFLESTDKEKNAIFADSLATLYRLSNRFDSAGWFAEEAAKFFNTTGSLKEAADNYYQAYAIAIDENQQKAFALKAQQLYSRVLQSEPENLEAKTKMAMTYLTTSSPMQGIKLLQEVLAQDPRNELALFNMGMLSIQSGQHERAVERLTKLVEINPLHIQGQLLLGIALMNTGDKQGAKERFEKVKQMDKDPAVQATVDSYLNDLK